MKPETLYQRAREILRGDPAMGKKRLAERLGSTTPTSRRLLWRFRGEVEGHLADPIYQSVRNLKETNPDWGAGKIARQLHLTVDRALLYLARWTGAQSFPSKPADPAGEPKMAIPSGPEAGGTVQDNVSGTARNVCYRGPQVKTLEDLLVYCQVNTSEWEVERWLTNKWEVGCRNPATGEILTAPLFQLKAWFKRKVIETTVRDVAKEMLEEFKKAAPVRPQPPRLARREGMLEIAVMDLHYGKLCWGPECGKDYNAEVAERMFWDAVEDLLAKAAGFRPEKILFPCGNDFYHTDILGRTTTAGTYVDSALGWKQAFVQGWQLLAKAIERLQTIAPVDVVVVSGNHDVQSAFHLGEVLQAWFHRTEGVTVDNSPTPRKYVAYHKCLLGLTHGSEEKHASLAMLLANERPHDWAKSSPSAREYHVGHLHHKRSLKIIPTVDTAGVLVRVIPSLTPPDSWHTSKGYGSKLAAEAYFWDPECGVTATLTHSPV